MKKFNIEVGGKEIIFEIPGWSQRANSEVMVQCGDTKVLVTAVMSATEPESLGFFPLTVNYEERFYAAGKILGSRFLKRESRPSDQGVLTSRLIDRSIRPVFPKGFKRAVQVIITCLSWDQENSPDVLGVLGASLALTLSDIPWEGPIGGIRVGEQNGKLILNPTYEEKENSSLDIFLTGKMPDKEILINMIEAGANQVDENLIMEAAKIATSEIQKLIDFQKQIQKKEGKEKISFILEKNTELEQAVIRFLKNKVEKILFSKDDPYTKYKQQDQLKQELIEFIKKDNPDDINEALDIYSKEQKKLIAKNVLEKEKRIDSRKIDELRKLDSEVGIIPRTHGSGLFSRGMTRALSLLTLGGPGDKQLVEGMEINEEKRFMHHYNFPPYSVGETRFLRAPGRREIGHGMLAEKALIPVLPKVKDFPYTIRIVSEMVCSNGSTSMAAICGSTLALMDAGVPIKAPVAGIAIGLIQDQKDYKVLTDIQGPEDANGGMDFKVAGTRQGITAVQLDVKVPGISLGIMEEALEKGKTARIKILDEIEKTIPKPRTDLSQYAPRIYTVQIDPEKIGEVIGSKGATIKKITEETGADIDIDDSGLIYVSCVEKDGAEKAIEWIEGITKDPIVGDESTGTVEKNLEIGDIIKMKNGKKGLARGYKLRVGETVEVVIKEIDRMGRINLSVKGQEPVLKPRTFNKFKKKPHGRRKPKTYRQSNRGSR